MNELYLNQIERIIMYTTIKGIYQNGQLTLSEIPPVTTGATEVLVTFTGPVPTEPNNKTPRKGGFAKDYILYVAPDFDEPLEDLKDYM